MESPWTPERKYGESKTKFGEYIVYYEESTFVVKIVHQLQYVYIQICLQLNIILFHNQKFISFFYFYFTQLSQLGYFAHFTLNIFWPPEICVPVALHHSNTSTLFYQRQNQIQTIRSGLFCMSIKP